MLCLCADSIIRMAISPLFAISILRNGGLSLVVVDGVDDMERTVVCNEFGLYCNS